MKKFLGPLASIVTLTFLIAVTNTAHGGWFIVSKDGDTLMVSQGKLKELSEGLAWIIDGSRAEVICYNPGQAIYAKGSVKQMCAEFSAMVDESMAGLTAEQRKMAEEALGGRKKGPVSVKVVPKGKGGKIAGMDTEKYDIIADGRLYEEVWVATDPALARETKELAQLMPEFVSCIHQMENSPETSPEYAKLMEKGWEMKSVSHEVEGVESSSEVIMISRRSIPDAEFEVPAGFQKVKFSDVLKATQGDTEEHPFIDEEELENAEPQVD